MLPEKVKSIRFENIQALRAFAALLVCAYHFRIAIIDYSLTETAFGNGWIGVPLFFMISGFIMVHTTGKIKHHSGFTSVKFILNRIIRIVPLYYFITFLMIADDLNDGFLVTHSERLLKSLSFVATFTDRQGPYYGTPVLDIGWTLNYEMVFYALFGISILFSKWRYYFLYAVFAVLMLIIPVLSGYGLSNQYDVFNNYQFTYLNLLTNPIWLHFIFGVTCGLVLPRMQVSKKPGRFLLPTSFFLFVIYFTNLSGLGFNVVYDLIFCGFLLVAFLLNDLHPQGYRLPKIITSIGDKSYSIYLLHPFIFSYLGFVFLKAGLLEITHSLFYFILAIVTTLLAANITYKFIELKFSAFLKGVVFKKFFTGN